MVGIFLGLWKEKPKQKMHKQYRKDLTTVYREKAENEDPNPPDSVVLC